MLDPYPEHLGFLFIMECKRCFKCGKIKPISEFYAHKKMADKHLNKCKDCTKEESCRNYKKNSKDEEWVKRERVRYRRRDKQNPRRESKSKTRKLFPKIGGFRRKVVSFGIDVKGKEIHHWNYNKPNSFVLLSIKAHHRIHRNVVVNYEDGFIYTLDGIKLDTKEKTKYYYEKILSKYDDLDDVITFMEI